MATEKSTYGVSLVIAIGAIIANLIGSGFATGQEIMQHAGAFGFGGIAGLAITFVLFALCGVTIMTDAKKNGITDTKELFTFYCGRHIAVFLTYAMPFILYFFFIAMLSGAGAALSQYYGVPYIVGRTAMAIIAILTVMLGFSKTIEIIGHIGPVIIIFVIAIVLSACFSSGGISYGEGSKILRNHTEIYRAGPTFWWCGFLYAAEQVAFGIIFYAKLGASMRSAKNAGIAAIVGCGSYVLVGMLLCLAFMRHADTLATVDVPMLVLANNISPLVGAAFAVILTLGIYTTATPLLWISVNTFAEDGTKKAKILSVVLGLLALAISYLPYQLVVNIVWPLSGYIGIFAMLGVLWSLVWRKVSAHAETKENEGAAVS